MVAPRMKGVVESGTVRMSRLAEEQKARGVDVISFAVGEPDFATPDHIVAAAKAALDEGFTKYTAVQGIPELRTAIAEKSRRDNGIPCEPSHIMVSIAKHAIYASLVAHVGRGDQVLVPDPGWVSYGPEVRLAEATPVPVPLRAEDDYGMTPEAVAEVITPRTRLLILNTPSNPTGAVQSPEALRGLADLAQDHDFLVLTDELYERILYDGRHLSLASLPGMYERTLTVNGFSKTYAMTGWRLGWLVAPPDLLEPVVRVQNHSLTCAASFVQRAGVAALRGPQDAVASMVAEFRRRRGVMVEGLRNLGFECPSPAGAFYTWPTVKGRGSEEELAELLLREAHVAVTPGTAFGSQGRGHLRFSFATSLDRIREGLDRLGRVAPTRR